MWLHQFRPLNNLAVTCTFVIFSHKKNLLLNDYRNPNNELIPALALDGRQLLVIKIPWYVP